MSATTLLKKKRRIYQKQLIPQSKKTKAKQESIRHIPPYYFSPFMCPLVYCHPGGHWRRHLVRHFGHRVLVFVIGELALGDVRFEALIKVHYAADGVPDCKNDQKEGYYSYQMC